MCMRRIIMERRRNSKQHKKAKRSERWDKILFTSISITSLALILLILNIPRILKSNTNSEDVTTTQAIVSTVETESTPAQIQTARITASGDMLYHDVVYGSAFDGQRYDFDNDYEQITPLVSAADLALGDFEGTIHPNRPLAGYPIFNAPEAVVQSIKNAGYDVMDLAHNHILDTGIEGLKYTANAFRNVGLDIFGVKTTPDEDILIKEVNGIKIAILGFAYGFNGIEATISQEDYDNYLYDLNMNRVKTLIERAEQLADFTIVMPQMGEEYRLTPTDAQKDTYHKMIDWGADVIFGGHPHVAEPTETIEKDGQKKFIIYSMGNLLSNQRLETLDNIWTERGVIMDITIQKENQQTVLTSVQAHPTWVSRTPINRTFEGFPCYDYQVFLAEDYLPGGQYAQNVDEETRQRIETAYHEMMELLNIQF